MRIIDFPCIIGIALAHLVNETTGLNFFDECSAKRLVSEINKKSFYSQEELVRFITTFFRNGDERNY